MVGSTPLSAEIDPEDYTSIVNAYRGCLRNAADEFGGELGRYEGDGTLLSFGYPDAHEDDAERAIYAALKVVADVKSITPPGGRHLQVRIGVTTGMVVISESASAGSHAFGKTVNVASRLKDEAEINAIVVDDDSRRLAGNLFDFRDRGRVKLKGIDEPARIWAVVGANTAASRFEARKGRTLTRMVGRDNELLVLDNAWQQARRGKGQVILTIADAGVGKSRLSAALIDAANREPCAVLRYFCSPYRQATPLHPCVQQLEHTAGFLATDSPEEKFEKLASVLPDAPGEERSLLAELVNVPKSERFQPVSLDSAVKRRRTMQALMSQLKRIADRTPTLIIFEDAQWSDETSRELLGILASQIERLRVLLIVLSRPADLGQWTATASVKTINLHPLTDEVSSLFIEQMAADRPLPDAVVKDIVNRTDGIPLFLEEITQAVLESRDDTKGFIHGEAGTALSMLLRASLLPRFNRLGKARAILESAAAIGREFTVSLLTHVVAEKDRLASSLDLLVASGLITKRATADLTFTFKHALIRDAAYEMMGRDRRRELHTSIGDALEKHFKDEAESNPELVAWHFGAAQSNDKAVSYWLLAGQRSLVRSAMKEALNHFRQCSAAIEAIPESPERLKSELRLTILTGMAQIATQGYAVLSTRDTFRKAREICKRLGDPPQILAQVLAVLHGLWTHSLLRGEFASAHDQATQILTKGDSGNDPMWRLMGHRFLGVTSYPLGRFQDASTNLEKGLAIYEPGKRDVYAAITVDDPRVVMLTYLSWAQMCAGQIDAARRSMDAAVAEARITTKAYNLAHSLNGAAFVCLTVDTPQSALQWLDELDTAIADRGIVFYEAVGTIFRGWCLAAMDRLEDAYRLLERGLEKYRATQSIFYLSGFLRMSAESYIRGGRLDTAGTMLEESLAIMNETNQRWDEAEIHRVRGTLFLAGGQVDAAEKSFRLACEVAKKQGARLWELRACAALAELVSGRPPPDDAVAGLQSIVSQFKNEGDFSDLRRARTLLSRTATLN
jgi:class 3 adenylate cyclase/tetratricopeptide (TPR) repeat protein